MWLNFQFALLLAIDSSKAQLATGVAADATASLKADEHVDFVVRRTDCRPDMTMVGGDFTTTPSAALA